MNGHTRRRLHSGAWRELMRRFDAGSATVGEFCAQEGVSVSSFYRWRALVDVTGDKALAASSKPAHAVPGRHTLAPAPAFIDLGTLAGSMGNTGKAGSTGPLELRLELGGGLVLHLSRH